MAQATCSYGLGCARLLLHYIRGDLVSGSSLIQMYLRNNFTPKLETVNVVGL